MAYEFAFGPFRLSSSDRILREDDRPVRLGSRALDILITLVTRAGELVSKRDLVAIVWPDTVVVEANLTVHVAALRRALGDGQGGNRYIVNIPGRGYRFVAPVSVTAEQAAELPRVQTAPQLHNLPAQLTKLVGREQDLRAVKERLANHRLVTLVGPGGVGKTAMALEVAEQSISQFRDGVWLVDLAPVADPELVATAFASSLRLEVRSDRPLPGLIGALANKNILLVLDNCEHVIDKAAELAVQLVKAARDVVIVATSRERLKVDGEQVYRLAPLESPPDSQSATVEEAIAFPAVQLFIERASASSNEFHFTDFDAENVARICRKLDGLPLAIEFAAARVDTFGVRGLASRLDDRMKLLGSGLRGKSRHQTITTTLDWSYQLLSASEQITFRRLAVFVGGFSIEAAEAVLRLDDAKNVTDDIATLVTKSLLIAELSDGEPRFRYLVTTRAFAFGKLGDADEMDLVARSHAEYFRDILEATQNDALKRPTLTALAKPEVDNIRAGLTWAFGPSGDRSIAFALAAASSPIWLNISLLTECHFWTSRALAALDDANRGGRQEMILQIEFGMSMMHAFGSGSPADSALMRGNEIAESLGDIGSQLRAISGLTNLCLRLEDFRGALRLAAQAKSVASRSTNPLELATAEFLFSGALVYVGEYTDAMSYAKKAFGRLSAAPRIAAIERSGLDHGIQARCVVANILWVQGAVDQAALMAKQIIADAERGGHALTLCFALAWCGGPFPLRLGDLSEADRAVTLLGDWAKRHDLPSYKASALAFRASLLAKHGDFAGAEAGLRLAIVGLREAQFEVQLTAFVTGLADALSRGGKSDEAAILADDAIDRCRRNDVQWWLPEAIRIKGEILMRQARPDLDAAKRLFEESLAISQRQGALFWSLRAAISLAEVGRELGDPAPAQETLAGVYGRFTEGFSTADLNKAKLILGVPAQMT